MQKIVIPSSVTEIGDDAFCDCSSLEKVVFSSSDTEVSMSAFRGCVSLKAIYVPKDSVDFYKEFFPRYMSWVVVEKGPDRHVKPEIVAKDILFSIRVITLDNETDSNILAQVKKKLEYMTDDEVMHEHFGNGIIRNIYDSGEYCEVEFWESGLRSLKTEKLRKM